MNRAQKKFRNYAVFSVFVLLTVLLFVINSISFTMAAADADFTTERIARQTGYLTEGAAGQTESGQLPEAFGLNPEGFTPGEGPVGRFGPMGPSSPEADASLRYFTVAFDAEGNPSEVTAFRISAVTMEEAVAWAKGLLKESTGWTSGTYRYRVYESGGKTYVTVIDQGRELVTAYRILVVSLIGEAGCLILSFLFLKGIGKRLFSPLEEADRKQKQFIAGANRGFRLPLTIISANTELLEREHGPDEQTRSIHRQIKKLDTLVEQLEEMSVFEEERPKPSEISLSDLMNEALTRNGERFAARGLQLDTAISPDIRLAAEAGNIQKILEELISNALRYALTRVSFGLSREGERILLTTANDCLLPEGPADEIFDRFTTLENAADSDTAGLGLAYVREIVRSLNGRTSASVAGGILTLRIAL